MERMCFIAYVFGKIHYYYIPIYAYSILKSYPNAHIRIYISDQLDSTVIGSINLLNAGDRISIRTTLFPHSGRNLIQRKKAIRFTHMDNEIYKYNYAYIGDIDIFMINETPSLLEQHIEHSTFLGMPYSNIVRSIQYSYSMTLKSLIRRCYTLGPLFTIWTLKNRRIHANKLSGLHFIHVKPYYNHISGILEQWYNTVLCSKFKYRNYSHPNMFHNECMLFDLIEQSGLGIPQINDYSTFRSDNMNPRRVLFRPHHGIHLGIFRNNIFKDEQMNLLQGKVYIKYANVLNRALSDSVFVEILNRTPIWILEQFQRMYNLYICEGYDNKDFKNSKSLLDNIINIKKY